MAADYVLCNMPSVASYRCATSCESRLVNTCCPCKSAAKTIAGALSPVTQVNPHPRAIPVACSGVLSLTGFSNIHLLTFGVVARDQAASARCRLGLGSAIPASDKPHPSTVEEWLWLGDNPHPWGSKNEAIT